MKIATILGTRPHFIKAAAVSQAIMKRDGIEEVIIHSGQHYSANMDSVFFEQLGIPAPKYRYDVNCMGHGAMVGRIVEQVSEALALERPDFVIVYGDTNTTLAGGIAAKILHIPLAHVEAGLRSYDPVMQEETNRILVDRISDILFCPTNKAIENLRAEGFECGNVKVVNCGDVMFDAVRLFRNRARPPKGFESLEPGQFYASTVHRAETTDTPDCLAGVLRALDKLSQEKPVVLPLHPRTKKMIENAGFELGSSSIRILEPVGYLEMLWLVSNASALITDGGGLQKEAYFLETPCVTLRDNTEWTELVDHGANLLAGTQEDSILECVDSILAQKIDFGISLYGKGNASDLIVDSLLEFDQ